MSDKIHGKLIPHSLWNWQRLNETHFFLMNRFILLTDGAVSDEGFRVRVHAWPKEGGREASQGCFETGVAAGGGVVVLVQQLLAERRNRWNH